MIWLVFTILTATVILTLTQSLRRGEAPSAEETFEFNVYREQLDELRRDVERGTLSEEEAESARAEIARRLLRMNRQARVPLTGEKSATLKPSAVFMTIAVTVGLGAIVLYAVYGGQGLEDQPLAARLSAPPEKQSLDIQIANVERRLRANPGDALGWTVIAPVYLQIGQFDKAADAYRRAIALGGESEEKLLGLVQALTFANGGVVSQQAKSLLQSVLIRNPKSVRARLWMAIAEDQDGKKAEAEKTYRQLLSENLPDPWKSMVEQQLAALQAPAPRSGESQEMGSGATDAEQAAMIRGMVERLAARLKENPADLEGWLKLIRSYAV
ncbi:MAG TPA: c-type cytochrome biogenesis protein CcmI, partial [Hyphomicrobiales bacterium]|nr:c-type cytochrome biogenesis protein CcmI [Hyphomicrobiales bacterium]